MGFICGYILKFGDGGPDEEQVLHVGTKAECERILDGLSTVSYSGDRPIKECNGVIFPYNKPVEPTARR